MEILLPGYPRHRENREIATKKSVKEFGNLAKTQGIWFAQVVNFLRLTVKDISIFAAKFPNFFKLDKSAKSVLSM